MNEIYLVFGAIQTVGATLSIDQFVSEKRQSRAEDFVERLALTAVELRALQQRIESSDAFEALVTEAVASACAADAEHRVGALAAIVKRGLAGDDAVISAMRLAERAVHDLENVDLRLLLVIACGPPAGGPNDVLLSASGGVDMERFVPQSMGHAGHMRASSPASSPEDLSRTVRSEASTTRVDGQLRSLGWKSSSSSCRRKARRVCRKVQEPLR